MFWIITLCGLPRVFQEQDLFRFFIIIISIVYDLVLWCLMLCLDRSKPDYCEMQ